ncbi:phosphocholine cytidylyltransferase family protein [Maridesulfovibrio zosterae]|uniref:phosphocholine cytidylyltransferase family protein n=1 Tax=Maridesulfovibrio zosterae TaxID=82171 RepID=UPI00041AB8A5|nr:phosphocholine cytidylyltransferase family protein [Maridesulfovibrio zosterae]
MKAIILAAGRGSRMKNETTNKPKCLIELMGRPLLHWQLDALKKASVDQIMVVRGYLAGKLKGDFITIDNPRWAESNMVETLRKASSWLKDEPCIVSYSDIVYRPEHIRAICECDCDIGITYDIHWEYLWKLRFNNPLSDAEIFKESEGLLLEIGGRADNIDEIKGQYMGLLYFTPRGWDVVDGQLSELGQERVDKLDMTALLRLLLDKGVQIGAIPVHGGWVEADSMQDIRAYEDVLAWNDEWSHDWRK